MTFEIIGKKKEIKNNLFFLDVARIICQCQSVKYRTQSNLTSKEAGWEPQVSHSKKRII